MGTILMVTIILTTLVLSVGFGVLLISGFVGLISRFLDKHPTPTPPGASS
ncbi:MAG: hypothetical protein ACE5HU_04520 [Acidobacteriota bacterium]